MILPNPSRRAFLSGVSVASVGLITGCSGASPQTEQATESAPGYTELLGVQLYTVRDKFENDAKGTLEALANIGVKDCETAGLFEHSAKDVRAIMDDLGMVSRSGHVSVDLMRDDATFAKALEDASILGQTHLYLPWIAEEERTLDGYRAVADLLNARGQQIKSDGMMIGYHNHEFEFIEQEGTTGYDVLLEQTDPELVTMELDFFWVADAGKDPLEILKKAPGRFSACHVKDRTQGGEMVSVGAGIIDYKTLLPLAEEAGIERFYVEHDNPDDSLKSVENSFSHLLA